MADMISVDSSNLAAVGYDAETRRLTVQFKKGSVYEYGNVPPETYDALMNASSKGDYFNNNVKGNFGFTKL